MPIVEAVLVRFLLIRFFMNGSSGDARKLFEEPASPSAFLFFQALKFFWITFAARICLILNVTSSCSSDSCLLRASFLLFSLSSSLFLALKRRKARWMTIAALCARFAALLAVKAPNLSLKSFYYAAFLLACCLATKPLQAF